MSNPTPPVIATSQAIFSSPLKIHQALAANGYLTTFELANLVHLAVTMDRPVLLEGPAGAGKTQLAVSLCKAAKMRMIRLQCYEGIKEDKAIGTWNQALRDVYSNLQAKNPGFSFDQIAIDLMGRKFFMPGPLLEAIESDERVLLLIDELDKVDREFEAMLLELLSVWEMSVASLGTIKAKIPPLCIITSNAERRLGDPLRRRCLYHLVEHPTPQLEADIVATSTPELPQELHFFIAGLAEALRTQSGMEKPPSISEMRDLARALHIMGKTRIEPGDAQLLLPMFAKTEQDRNYLLLKDRFGSVVRIANLKAAMLMEEEQRKRGQAA